jgi:hypothetical protein
MTSATGAQDFSDHTYVLPLRRSTLVTDDEDLTSYLRWLAQHMDVIIVDGSPAEIYAHHEVLWGHLVRHIPVTSSSPNGKVAGVCDGVHAASTPFVIIADDDVRYHEDALSAVSALLACHEAVVPQNYFHPTPGMPDGIPAGVFSTGASGRISLGPLPFRGRHSWLVVATAALCSSRTSN